MPLTIADLQPYLPLISADFANGGYTMTIEPFELGYEYDRSALTVYVDLRPAGGSSVTIDGGDPLSGAADLANGMVVEIVHDYRSWPECPEHHYPMYARVRGDAIEWHCGKGGHSPYLLGQLFGTVGESQHQSDS